MRPECPKHGDSLRLHRRYLGVEIWTFDIDDDAVWTAEPDGDEYLEVQAEWLECRLCDYRIEIGDREVK